MFRFFAALVLKSTGSWMSDSNSFSRSTCSNLTFDYWISFKLFLKILKISALLVLLNMHYDILTQLLINDPFEFVAH